MAFPTYREHGVAWCRGVDPVKVLGLFRGVNHGGWDPKEHNFHLYTIVIGSQTPARHRLRDGHPARRCRGRRASSTSATAPPARATSTRRSSGPRRRTPRSSSSARTTSGRSPSRSSGRPGSRSTARAQGFGFPGIRVDGNDVFACLAVTQKALDAARQRPGPDADRGVHLPDGRAHHHRRPDPVPAAGRARGVEAEGPDRAGQGVPGEEPAGRRGVLRRASTPRPRTSAADLRKRCLELPDPAPTAIFENVYARPPTR